MEDLHFSRLQDLFRERFFEMLLRREKILPETVEKFKSWGVVVGSSQSFESVTFTLCPIPRYRSA